MNSYDPLGDFMRVFPDAPITPGQAGMIAAAVKAEDADVWADTLFLYEANYNPAFPRDYNPRKIGTMLEVFRDKKARKERQGNGTDRQLNGVSKGQLALDGFNERRRIEQELRALRTGNEADSR